MGNQLGGYCSHGTGGGVGKVHGRGSVVKIVNGEQFKVYFGGFTDVLREKDQE